MAEWYLYENNEVIGPFTPEDLTDRLQSDTLVCKAGQENWRDAADVPELNAILEEPPETESPDRTAFEEEESTAEESDQSVESIEPTLDKLKSICEKASDQNLLREHESFLDEYGRYEKEIILEEINQRNLLGEN